MYQQGKNHPLWMNRPPWRSASAWATAMNRGWKGKKAALAAAKLREQAERDRVLGPEAPRVRMSRTRPAREQ